MTIMELKKCCCCIPLRYGLLAFGYIRLATVLTVVALLICLVVVTLSLYNMMGMWVGAWVWEMAMISIAMLVLVVLDALFNVLFLIGEHRKSVTLLRVSYVYSIITLIIITAGLTAISVLLLGTDVNVSLEVDFGFGFVNINFIKYALVFVTVVHTVVGVYFVILQRSEIRKLSNNNNFRFNNHASDELKSTLENSKKNTDEIAL